VLVLALVVKALLWGKHLEWSTVPITDRAGMKAVQGSCGTSHINCFMDINEIMKQSHIS
jgi:hypothetical protein